MLAGREFEERDQRYAIALPLVLNESAARALFGDRSAIGQRVRDDKQSYEVVGVVHNAGISKRVARLKPVGVIKG